MDSGRLVDKQTEVSTCPHGYICRWPFRGHGFGRSEWPFWLRFLMTRAIWPFAQLTVARRGGLCGKWAKSYLTKSMILDFIARRAHANDRPFDRMTRARQRDGRVIRRYWSMRECGLGQAAALPFSLSSDVKISAHSGVIN